MSFTNWSHTEQDGIITLTIDTPDKAVNVLSGSVLEELSRVLDGLANTKAKGMIVRSAKAGFIAGADVNEIAGLLDPTKATAMVERGQAVLMQLARLPFPTVAAIHGVCLGGGLELALACTHRVCSDDLSTRMGLPEVKLGIHPGFGGCVRLPRVVGLQKATDWILAGKTVTARQAKKASLVGQAVPREILLDAARRELDRRHAAHHHGGLVDRLLTGNPLGRKVFFKQARKMLSAKVRPDHYPAPFAALEVLERIHGLGSVQAHQAEAISCGALAPLAVTKNLIRVFFASEKLKHQDAARMGKADAAAIQRAVVVGAGVMGAGIAGEFAKKGLVVRLADLSDKAVGKGLKGIAKEAKRAGRNAGRGEAERIMSRLLPTTDLKRLGHSDLIIEAVAENMGIKQSLFGDAARQLGDKALLLTNTSSLGITDMFAGVPRPERACGMHFFNPVPKMPLVEVVVGDKTAPETVALVTALSVRIGKLPLIVQECPGFLVNRILMPFINEAMLLLQEGARIEHVDQVLYDFGMPMAAFRLADEVGLDICHHVADVLHSGYGERMTPASGMGRLFDTGRYGRKVGKGFYKYENGKAKGVDPETYRLVEGRGSQSFGDEDVRDRCILAMVAEAARVLEEGIVENADMLDAGMVFGTGFPPFRGGLMRYVEERGAGQVVAVLDRLAQQHGERFVPNQWLRDFARGH
ncbi:MAG: 3-hydroxyacyl-CoA dehydrogenase NAD-binding domain-containing protein [Nitrospirota bacterium]|nr:3-hydroxyacyl-CoA dehydrogenase NAD-binding domain-containing protein [Nitrospirota bacterium]